jgi:hypothetical protein
VVIKSLEANYRKVAGHFRRHHHGRRPRGLILDVAAAIRLGLANSQAARRRIE